MKCVSLRKQREPSPLGHIALRTAALAASARSGSSRDAVTAARASTPIKISNIGAVGQKKPRLRQLFLDRGGWQPVLQSHFCNLAAMVEQHTISLHDERLRASLSPLSQTLL